MLGHRQKCFTSCWAKIFHPHSSRRTLWNAICSTNEANACKVHGRKGRKAKHRISSLAPVSLHLGHPLNHRDNAKKWGQWPKKKERRLTFQRRQKKTKRNCLRLSCIWCKKNQWWQKRSKNCVCFLTAFSKAKTRAQVLFSDFLAWKTRAADSPEVIAKNNFHDIK